LIKTNRLAELNKSNLLPWILCWIIWWNFSVKVQGFLWK